MKRDEALPMVAPRAEDSGASVGFAADLRAALSHRPRSIAPKYFYDAAGSALFDRICDLPEYYPTRTELALLAERAPAIARHIGPDAEIVEFGAGSSHKIGLLLGALTRPRRFVPIDISAEHLHAAAERVRRDWPALSVEPVVADFSEPLSLPPRAPGSGRRVGFFPGSSIGNFTPDEAVRFLVHARRLLAGGGLLVGVDLVKDPAVLHAAYNDAAGVTAAFNLNVLVRANRELGCDFDLDGYAHYAFYAPLTQRIEMHLLSRKRQHVTLGGESFEFDEGESLHTENSHKFTVEGFQRLAASAGWQSEAVWCDPQQWFSLHWLANPD